MSKAFQLEAVFFDIRWASRLKLRSLSNFVSAQTYQLCQLHMSEGIRRPYSSLTLPNDHDSFRLLAIQGALRRDSPIVASLYIARLDENPKFEALSYYWGTNEQTENVIVNGERLPITQNLAAALRALRLQNKTRVLWVDAICIDQDYNPEKNVQVRMMRRIYATSIRTIAWLGVSDESSREAFRIMQRRGVHRYRNVVNAVLRRPWFRRVWIVQEVALAPEVTVQCGDDTIEWQHIIRHCSELHRLRMIVDVDAPPGSRHLHPSFFPRILDATRRKIQAGGRLSILEALRSFRTFDSTEGVDKVYGILGLLEDPDVISVDYASPMIDVFREIAMHSMRASQRLEFLQDCLPREGPVTTGWNSWIPDWTDKEQVVEHDVEFFGANEPFRASCDRPCSAVVVGHDGSLQVSAQFITTIAEVSQGLPSYRELRERFWPSKNHMFRPQRALEMIVELMSVPESWNAVACNINGQHGTLQDRYATNEAMSEALWNTLNRAPPFPDVETARRFDKWLRFIDSWQSAFRTWQKFVAQPLPWGLVWLVTGPYMAATTLMLLYRVLTGEFVLEVPQPPQIGLRSTWKLGRTNNGLLGVFPAPTFVAPRAMASKVGDAVVILDGGPRPFVLRAEGSKWRVVGDAYVHGIMHGAAFDESKCVAIDLV